MKAKANKKFRDYLVSLGCKQWEAADFLGINESSFSRLLRRELPQEQRQELMSKLKELEGRK